MRALAFHDAGQAFDETQRINLRELRTSSGLELRVVVPVFNMPFRLIYSWNTYRDAFQPARRLSLRRRHDVLAHHMEKKENPR